MDPMSIKQALLSRRDILRLAGTFAAVTQLEGCEGWLSHLRPTPVVTAVSKTIDPHCHVFNSRDLPITSFVRDVVLEDQPNLVKNGLEPMVWFLSLIMDAEALTAAQEADDLRSNRDARLSDVAAGGASTLTFSAGAARSPVKFFNDEDLINKRVSDAVNRMRTPDPRSNSLKLKIQDRHPELFSLEDNQNEAFFSILANRTRVGQVHALTLGAKPATVSEIAEGIRSVPDEIYGVVLLATLLTRPRAELADRLAELPSSGAQEIALFAPAMVDYSYWLDDQDVSPLKAQIDVMAELAASPRNKAAFHPWVSFCPWREIAERSPDNSCRRVNAPAQSSPSTQLDMVKEAVLKRGLIGIKLYPVMGFRPYGNAGASTLGYPERLTSLKNWDSDLDCVLGELYDFCIANDVPIMAHCSLSQYPEIEAGKHGSPTNWKVVLENARWRALRLNIAHAGGIWNMVPSDPSMKDDGWTESLIPMLASPNYPNLYADIADYDTIIEANDAHDLDVKTLSALKALLEANPAAKSKLMYGTDWVMLSRCAHAENYYPSMKQRIPAGLGLTDIEVAGYFGGNAARFMGIRKNPDGTKPAVRARLEQFRYSKGLNLAVLSNWD